MHIKVFLISYMPNQPTHPPWKKMYTKLGARSNRVHSSMSPVLFLSSLFPIFYLTRFNFFLEKIKYNITQKLGTTAGAKLDWVVTGGTSFFRRISSTLRWWLECNSFEKVGLQAGLYSGKSRPDLNRTPQALQRVLAPSGPVLHCGVFCTPQWLHRLGVWVPPTVSLSFFFCFFTGGCASA